VSSIMLAFRMMLILKRLHMVTLTCDTPNFEGRAL
jgi:hypothetical protein